MDRLIERNKTYRVHRDDGETDLYHILLVLGEYIKVKDLKKNAIKIIKKATFQKQLDEGEIYVSANMKKRILPVLRKILNRT